MERKELEKMLKKEGWTIIHGAKHDMAIKDGSSAKIPLPRHKGDIPIGTLNSILKDAGLK
ncbi:MAG: type II toxin-antitoxin system HicA family toxin [Oscillospiraceae bacterium]